MDFVPDPGHFASDTPPLGDGTLTVTIAGITVCFEGLSAELIEAARRRYGPFVSGEHPQHRVAVGRGETLYLDPAKSDYLRLEERHHPEGTVLLSSNFAAIRRPGGGRNELKLSSPSNEKAALQGIENCLRWIVADLAVQRGGFVLHSSGLVRDGRAHVFFGPSGAGKSTVAGLSPDCLLLSDDLVLLLRQGGNWKAATTPFQGTLAQEAKERGVYPLAGLYRLVQRPEAELVPLSAAVSAGMVLACCPFIGDETVRRESLLPLVEDCTRSVPTRELRFSKDPSFWDVIRREDRNG